MQKIFHDKLKEALKDVEVDGKKLFDVVLDLDDKAESKDKVQKANEEISKERDALRDELKAEKESKTALEKALEDSKGQIEKLKEGQLSEEERREYLATKKNGMTPDAEAKFNRLEENIKALTETLEVEKKSRVESEEKAKQAYRKENEVALDNRALTELGKADIKGADAEIALLKLKADGLIDVVENENGTFTEKFILKTGEGKILESNLGEIVTDFAAKHENLVSPSGNRGSGNDHSTDPAYKNGNFYKPDTKNLGEARETAAAEIDHFTK